MSILKQLATVAGRAMFILLLPLSAYPQELSVDGLQAQTSGQSVFEIVGEPVAGATVNASLSLQLETTLRVGAVITIRQHWMDEARLQHDNPNEPAYVSIQDSLQTARVYEKSSGVEGGLDSLVAVPGFRLEGAEIEAGRDINFSVSDLLLPRVSGRSYSLIVYLQQPGEAPIRIPGNGITIVPDDFSQISVSASSLVDPGQDVGLWVRMEDQYGNLVEDRSLSLDLSVNGRFRQRVELEQAVSAVSGVSFDSPGHYQVELRTGGGGIRALSNPVRVGEHISDIFWVDFGAVTTASTGYLEHEDLLANGAGKFDLILPADYESYLTGSAGFSVDQIAMFRLEEPDSVIRLIDAGGLMIDVAQPELTTDLRNLTLDTLRLVQVVAGPGHHLWLGHRAAAQGYPIGFVGSGYSRQYPGERPDVYTAVFASSDNWFDAMRAGQTYVAVGERIIVLPGAQDPGLTDVRDIEFEIVAGSPIARVTLFKNGVVEDVRQGAVLEQDNYELSLLSESHPFSDVLSRPRNAREWVGYVTTRNAALSATESPGFKLNQQSPDRIDFLIRTHGGKRSLGLSLQDSTPDTVLEIGIAPGFEDAAWLPVDRLPQETPMQRFLVPLSGTDGSDGAVRSLEVDGYRDQVFLRPERAALADSGSYTYRYQDRTAARIGDYYYMMVELRSGAVAYSSTVFIGL